MKINHLLIALGFFAAMMLGNCSPKAAPSLAVPPGAQAGDYMDVGSC